MIPFLTGFALGIVLTVIVIGLIYLNWWFKNFGN